MPRLSPAISASVEHFRELCDTQKLPASEVKTLLEQWSSKKGWSEKQKRNVERFVKGDAQSLGRGIKDDFLEFCRVCLKIKIESDDEFDLEVRFTNYLDRFIRHNAYKTFALKVAAGRYAVFRPTYEMVRSGELNLDGVIHRSEIRIREEGSSGRFAFEFSNSTESGMIEYVGHALSSSHWIYLVGFEKDLMHRAVFSTLAFHPEYPDGGVLIGIQQMQVNDERSQSVCCRPCALARIGRGSRDYEDAAKAWIATACEMHVGYAADLVQIESPLREL